MSLDWEPVAAAIKAAREHIGMTQDELAVAAGRTRNTVINLENGRRPYKTVPNSVIQVGRVFGWSDPVAAVNLILAGGAPPPTDPPSRTPAAAADMRHVKPGRATEGMPLRVERVLEDGRLVDSAIIEADGVKFMILMMTDSDAEPSRDQMATGLAKWSDLERHARNLSGTDGDQGDS